MYSKLFCWVVKLIRQVSYPLKTYHLTEYLWFSHHDAFLDHSALYSSLHLLSLFIPATVAVISRCNMIAPYPPTQLNCPRVFLIQRLRMQGTIYLTLQQVQTQDARQLTVLWVNYCPRIEYLSHHLAENSMLHSTLLFTVFWRKQASFIHSSEEL